MLTSIGTKVFVFFILWPTIGSKTRGSLPNGDSRLLGSINGFTGAVESKVWV